MDFFIYMVLAFVAFIIYAKFKSSTAQNDSESPSLFENIHFMRNEVQEEEKFRQRLFSQTIKKRSRINSGLESQQQQNVADLLNTLGIISEASLSQITKGFEPVTYNQGEKIKEIHEKIIVVQQGQVKLRLDEGHFHMEKIVSNGGVIYSKLAVINFLLNGKKAVIDEGLYLETGKTTTLLILDFKSISQ